jgi:glycosyltransferase involved in cell wall biosynthesis
MPVLRHPAAIGFADVRVAVVSPFVDRRHGTERCLAEQLERFAAQPGAEIHLYSQRVDDLAGVVRYPETSAGRIAWHKVPRLPGPHILGYVWWFVANHCQRWWDARFRGLKFDLTYSPGINAMDADAISIHVLFTEFFRRVRPHLRFVDASIFLWPVILHRRLYYRLICLLEQRVYPRKNTALTTISERSAGYARSFFKRDDVTVICYGVDTRAFHPSARLERRQSARNLFRITAADCCLLLIGNDWKSKGLDTLLHSISACSEIAFRLLVVGSDDPRVHAEMVRALHLDSNVQFCGPSADVMQFYAAADVYASPSREDAFALPPIEAMACGLPVITSSNNGGSQIITEGVNGFIMADADDSVALTNLIRRLAQDQHLRNRIGENAARTAQEYTWDRNAADTWEFLKAAHAKKTRTGTR